MDARYYHVSVQIEIYNPDALDGKDRLTVEFCGMQECVSAFEGARLVAAKIPAAVEKRIGRAVPRPATEGATDEES